MTTSTKMEGILPTSCTRACITHIRGGGNFCLPFFLGATHISNPTPFQRVFWTAIAFGGVPTAKGGMENGKNQMVAFQDSILYI